MAQSEMALRLASIKPLCGGNTLADIQVHDQGNEPKVSDEIFVGTVYLTAGNDNLEVPVQ